MGLRIPQNQTVTSKYTSGKEYMFSSTYREYIGYYYELNGKLFAGKEFSTTAPELIRIDSSKVNNLLTSPSTYVYGKISGIKLDNNKPNSIISKSDILANKRYFIKKLNSNPILIKEINQSTFESSNNNPLYQTIEVEIPEGGYFANQNSLDELDKKMPGIKIFLTSELPPD